MLTESSDPSGTKFLKVEGFQNSSSVQAFQTHLACPLANYTLERVTLYGMEAPASTLTFDDGTSLELTWADYTDPKGIDECEVSEAELRDHAVVRKSVQYYGSPGFMVPLFLPVDQVLKFTKDHEHPLLKK